MKKVWMMVACVVILAVLAACGLAACEKKEKTAQQTPSDDHVTSKYVAHEFYVKDDGTFRILQLTDLHFIDSEVTNTDATYDYTLRDEWAMQAITSVIEKANPDLLILTGDVIFTVPGVGDFFTLNLDNYDTFVKLADFIDSFDIPWLFLFGNHDEEGDLVKEISGDHNDVKRMLGEYLLSDEIKNCYYVHGDETINGVGNYVVNILNRDGSVNQSLVIFDSGSYLQEPGALKTTHYECVHEDQLDWYEDAIKDISKLDGKEDGELVSSIVFQHIPFPEYRDVIDACIDALGENWRDTIKVDGTETEIETDIGTITYHFGVYNEGEVCCSWDDWFNGVNYGERSRKEFARLKEVGSTKYVFCGHDHRNTYSMTYEGITLTYGMSIDYSANGLLPVEHQQIYDETEQRGGTLITLGKDSSVTITQIPFSENLYQEEVERRANAG